MICSAPVITAYSSAISAEPKISRFIFRDAPYGVICQSLRGGKIRKGFPVITAYSSANGSEPKISSFISETAMNGIKGKPFVGGVIAEVGVASCFA